MAQNQKNPWTDIDKDLAESIKKIVNDASEFTAFECALLDRISTAPVPKHPPFPYLLEDMLSAEQRFRFYSILCRERHMLQFTQAENRRFQGQSQGYLVTYDLFTNESRFPTLVNPLTGVSVSIPFDKFDFYSPLFVSGSAGDNPHNYTTVVHIRSFEQGPHIGYCKGNTGEWQSLKMPTSIARAYHRGNVYYCWGGVTKAVQLQDGSEFVIGRLPTDPLVEIYWLVEAPDALLGIAQNCLFRTDDVEVEKCKFEVFELDESKEKPIWIPKHDLNDLMIFLNKDGGFCLPGRKTWSGVYFTKWNGAEGGKAAENLVGRYDVDRKSSKVVGWCAGDATWIYPH